MANPTTNYSFVLPTSTDLVTDLPADFDVALQGVDTRLKALQPGTTSGDLAYSSATANTNVRLGIGTTGQVLAVVAGVPAWATTADQTPLTTKGDLFTFSTVDARLPVGTNGQVLTADSVEATGLKWVAPASGGMTLITSGTLSGATVTLSSIPTTYNNLQLIIRNARPSNSGFTTRIDPNGGNYNGFFNGFNSSGTAVGTNISNMELNPSGNFSTSDTNSIFVATFYDYARATLAKLATLNGRYDNTAVKITFASTLQLTGNAFATTSLAIISNSTWSAGNYELYGVK